MGAVTSFATKSIWMIKALKEELDMALVKKRSELNGCVRIAAKK